MPYVHLTVVERENISQMLFSGYSVPSIAKSLSRDRSTVYREVKRNGDPSGQRAYLASRAENLAKQRRRSAKLDAPRKLDNPALLRTVKKGLRDTLSPEQIAGCMKKAAKGDPEKSVSHFAIYRWIERNKKNGGQFWKCLRQAKKKRRKKYGSKNRQFWRDKRRTIDQRPKIVDRRTRVGDWEGDLVEGLNKTSYLLTLVERKTGYLISRHIPNRQSVIVRKKIVEAFRSIPNPKRRTLTLDNGTEFSDFLKIEQLLDMKVYFANPYCSWERGTNENTNGLLRQFVPKGTDIRNKSHQELAADVNRINNRPRKRLNYQTPAEMFHNS